MSVPSISQMTHWRLRWCQSSVHPWHPLLQILKNNIHKSHEVKKIRLPTVKLSSENRHHQEEVLHLFRCFTHTPRCRGAFSGRCIVWIGCKLWYGQLGLDLSIKTPETRHWITLKRDGYLHNKWYMMLHSGNLPIELIRDVLRYHQIHQAGFVELRCSWW